MDQSIFFDKTNFLKIKIEKKIFLFFDKIKIYVFDTAGIYSLKAKKQFFHTYNFFATRAETSFASLGVNVILKKG